MVSNDAADANSWHTEQDAGFLDISCIYLPDDEAVSFLTPIRRYELTFGVLANVRVLYGHRRRLPAAIATPLRWCLFKRLHAQLEERQNCLAQLE